MVIQKDIIHSESRAESGSPTETSAVTGVSGQSSPGRKTQQTALPRHSFCRPVSKADGTVPRQASRRLGDKLTFGIKLQVIKSRGTQ